MKRNPNDMRRILFRECLIRCRKDREINQQALAKQLDKPQSFVSKYEQGERLLDVIEVYEICAVLDIKPSVLFTQFEEALKKGMQVKA